MSSKVFNEAQLKILEEEFQKIRAAGLPRPTKKARAAIATALSPLGTSTVTRQDIGKWFGRRARKADGVKLLQPKSTEQTAMLKESFDRNPYPDDEEQKRLIFATLLTKRQISDWFKKQRSLRSDELRARGYPARAWGEPGPTNSAALKKMWNGVEVERVALQNKKVAEGKEANKKRLPFTDITNEFFEAD
ncbi:hypothetical protein EXIGLDRAFT_827856 [Exidia glandulosa HHB12029]|uniref:Homeobox domain-containing protein n=1 Tax=Exidia glandulosa HHB12029 TaxID=1314781 RepID=A0A165QPX0_EXIGL|nr:hypothetical protein EXIGLDRAFT_827856 [Exidia glandulosa HHB12029]